MKIRFITDGNNRLGLGHIYQSKTFANYIREKQEYNPDIIFLTKSSEEIASIIRNEGYDVFLFASDDEIFEFLKKDNPDVIIFDKLDVDPEFAKRIHEKLSARLAIFTCITDANNYADVTVMGAMDSHFLNVIEESEGRISYHGPKYLILRPEFFRYSKKIISQQSKRENLLEISLLFGGADPAGLTCSILEEIVEVESIKKINIIIGNAFKDSNRLDRIVCNATKSNILVMKNISNVDEVLSSSDLVMVSPGISFFETMKCNTPALIFSQNEFQQQAWENDINTYSFNQVYLVKELIKERKFIFPYEEYIKNMQIGLGINELITRIIVQ